LKAPGLDFIDKFGFVLPNWLFYNYWLHSLKVPLKARRPPTEAAVDTMMLGHLSLGHAPLLCRVWTVKLYPAGQ
jgi:hypothetical protein